MEEGNQGGNSTPADMQAMMMDTKGFNFLLK